MSVNIFLVNSCLSTNNPHFAFHILSIFFFKNFHFIYLQTGSPLGNTEREPEKAVTGTKHETYIADRTTVPRCSSYKEIVNSKALSKFRYLGENNSYRPFHSSRSRSDSNLCLPEKYRSVLFSYFSRQGSVRKLAIHTASGDDFCSFFKKQAEGKPDPD